MARWKARGRLPISANKTFYTSASIGEAEVNFENVTISGRFLGKK